MYSNLIYGKLLFLFPFLIIFLGETDNPASKTVELELADMDEAEIVEMVQESHETPRFISQVSCSSDHSASDPSSLPPVPTVQQQQQQHQNLQAESAEGNSKMQGPMVGTTPSQMSPMGTPVHQALSEQSDPSKEEINVTAKQANAATTVSSNSTPAAPKKRFDSQSSLPGSPFHQPNPEVKSGSSVFGPFGGPGPVDDAFSSILSMSDADRRHDAWIPSDATSHILKAMVSGGQTSFVPAVEQLSTPGIISSEPQVSLKTFWFTEY